jgi:glutathione S-transferase
MEAVVAGGAFKIFSSVCALLIIKTVVLAGATGAMRGKQKSWVNPEDKKADGEKVDEKDEVVDRFVRAHQNAVHNVLPFGVVGLLYTLHGPSEMAMQIYCYTFFVARVLHSLCYLKKWQPWRTMFFGVGALCIIGMGTQVIMRAFGS